MGVRRTELAFEGQFTQIPNAWVRDERLSRKARGVLTEIMSHRVGWHVSVNGLMKAGPEGRDAIKSALIELKDAGYLKVSQTRGDGGRWNEVEYELNDPSTADGFSVTGGLAVSGSPASGQSAPKNTIYQEDHQEESNVGQRSVAHPLPGDWAPNVRCRTFALEQSLDVEHEGEQFRAHAQANDRRQRDWHAAFRQWLGNAAKWRKERQPATTDQDFGRDEWMYRA